MQGYVERTEGQSIKGAGVRSCKRSTAHVGIIKNVHNWRMSAVAALVCVATFKDSVVTRDPMQKRVLLLTSRYLYQDTVVQIESYSSLLS